MDHPVPDRRRTLRRAGIIVAGLAVIGGAVAVLRAPEAAVPTPKPPPPAQTAVKEFAADTVVVPGPGNPPAQPAMITVEPGPQRLVVAWGPERTGKPEPERAAGYEIRWGRDGTLSNKRLLAQPIAQLDALDNDVPYEIEVRTIDAFGKRSLPALTSGTPKAPDAEPPWTFQDRFASRVVPDPVRFRVIGTSDCGRATRGEGYDGKRLVVSGQCGAEPMVVRPRAPFRLRDAPVDGELGRVVISTDHPGQGGELTIDLVPGPADLVGSGSSPAPGDPAVAHDDPALPPGTIRVRVDGGDSPSVQVVVGPGTPRSGGPAQVVPLPKPEIGVSVRWEVVFRVDGVRVVRDGKVVAAGDVVPTWREATALFGFVGGPGGLHAAADLIGFLGAPTAPAVLVVPPVVDTGRAIMPASPQLVTPSGGKRVEGATGGQVRITLLPTNQVPAQDEFTVDIGGRSYPARPAVPGQQPIRGARFPIVADVPADALILRADEDILPVRVQGPVRRGEAAARVLSASVELTAPPGAVSPISGAGTDTPVPRTRLALARPSARFLDAAGQPLDADQPVPKGRLVLEVSADGPGGQRLGGELGGLAGVEVRLDGEKIAGIPTVADGPGVAGVWRLALNTANLNAGQHTIEVKAIGVDPKAAFAVAYAPFTVR